MDTRSKRSSTAKAGSSSEAQAGSSSQKKKRSSSQTKKGSSSKSKKQVEIVEPKEEVEEAKDVKVWTVESAMEVNPFIQGPSSGRRGYGGDIELADLATPSVAFAGSSRQRVQMSSIHDIRSDPGSLRLPFEKRLRFAILEHIPWLSIGQLRTLQTRWYGTLIAYTLLAVLLVVLAAVVCLVLFIIYLCLKLLLSASPVTDLPPQPDLPLHPELPPHPDRLVQLLSPPEANLSEQATPTPTDRTPAAIPARSPAAIPARSPAAIPARSPAAIPARSPAAIPAPSPTTTPAPRLGEKLRMWDLRLQDQVKPTSYRLMYHFHFDDESPAFFFEACVAIYFTASPRRKDTPIDRIRINAHSTLQVNMSHVIVFDQSDVEQDDVYLDSMNTLWKTLPYVDLDGNVRSGIPGKSLEKFTGHTLKYSARYELVPLLTNCYDRNRYPGSEVPNVFRVSRDILEMRFTRPWTTPSKKMLLIRFNGTTSSGPPGLFVTRLPDNHVVVEAQLKDTLARTAFPCFDMPNLRAAFQIEVAHPAKYTALSHMPTTSVEQAFPEIYKHGEYVWTCFQQSLLHIAPHQVGFVIGPFREIDFQHGLVIVKTVPKFYSLPYRDVRNQTNFACFITLRALSFVREYFPLVDPPLPEISTVFLPTKLAVDSATSGLILHREETTFLNVRTATAESLEKAARSVIHLFLYQYIGNLMSPFEGSGIRVIEAFLAFLENECLHTIFPDWDVWENFQTSTVFEVLKFEDMDRAHTSSLLPRIPFYTVDKVRPLTNQRGAVVLKMFDSMTPGIIHRLLNSYATLSYLPISMTVVAKDLSTLIKPSPGVPTKVIETAAKEWLTNSSYPLVYVTRFAGGEMLTSLLRETDIILYQSKYSEYWMRRQSLAVEDIPRACSTKTAKVLHQPIRKENGLEAIIPMHITLVGTNGLNRATPFWQTSTYHRVCAGFGVVETEAIIVNYDQEGLFRVDYSHEDWEMIGAFMMRNPLSISPVTRAMLIDDAMTMAKLGRIPFVTAFMMPLALRKHAFAKSFKPMDIGMYERSMRAIADVTDSLHGTSMETLMEKYIALVASAWWDSIMNRKMRGELDYAFMQGFTNTQRNRFGLLLHNQAVFWACYCDMDECVQWSTETILNWMRSRSPSEKTPIAEHYSNTYCAAVRFGPDEMYDFMLSRYTSGDLSETHKREVLWGLICTRHQRNIYALLKYESNRILVEDIVQLWTNMNRLRISAWYAFKYQRTYWNNIPEKISDEDILSHIAVAVTSAATKEGVRPIKNFIKKHKHALPELVVALIKDNILEMEHRFSFQPVLLRELGQALKKATTFVWTADIQRRSKLLPPDRTWRRSSPIIDNETLTFIYDDRDFE